jgi:ornithine--oxo-acid transaminase
MAATQTASIIQSYIDHVNPQWVRLLNLFQLEMDYTVCSGIELTTRGDVALDFLSGYCVHNAGTIIPPSSTLSTPSSIVGDRRCFKATFPVSPANSRGVSADSREASWRRHFSPARAAREWEAAIKFSRATTGREGLLYSTALFTV